MFYSENLLAKEGPLAQVWLAANLERKLSKHQFIQSNIIQSTQAIVKATTQNDDSEALALRLSGQLLYGVVRIYSRKAKYLLDDVSDALLKLKSAFKTNSHTVTLPVNATIVPSVNQLILQDTITQSDLLFQEPLTFDEEPTRKSNYFGSYDMEDTTIDSIELPRTQVDELDNLQNDDLDIDLNFDIDQHLEDKEEGPLDLSFDNSIEIGRADEDGNLSRNVQDDYDRGIDLDFGGGWDEPIFETEEPAEVEQNFISPPSKKQRAPRISTAGQRKIANDREIEIPIKNFSNTEDIVITGNSDGLDLNFKRSYIDSILKDNSYIRDDIAKTLLSVKSPKRQKTAPSPPLSDDLPELEHSGEEAEPTEQANYDGYDEGINFDFGWDDDNVAKANEAQEAEVEVEEEQQLDEFNSNSQEGISETTTAISKHLSSLFKDKPSTTFTDIIEKDSQSETPLSNIPKSEATRVFFELLVLGTGDAIELKQDELFGEIQVKPRQNLYQKFL